MEFEPKEIRVSPIPKTWILDLDGTLVVHDGPYIIGKDQFLPGAREFLNSIPDRDMIIFLTARMHRKLERGRRFTFTASTIRRLWAPVWGISGRQTRRRGKSVIVSVPGGLSVRARNAR